LTKVIDEIPTGLNLKTEFHGKAPKRGEIQFPVISCKKGVPLPTSASPSLRVTNSFPFNLGVQVVEVEWDRLAEY
jgi:hypothetical protein